MTTKDKVNKAFRLLRKAGYFAQQDYWCCQSCAWNAVPEDSYDSGKVVFYHHQDNDAWKGKELGKRLYLAWAGDGNEIVRIIQSVGLATEWDGTENNRIQILPELQ